MDKLHTIPVDGRAAREMVAAKLDELASYEMPNLHREPIEVLCRRRPNLPNLAGKTIAGAKVIGFYAWKENARHSLWVVQCGCGRYQKMNTNLLLTKQRAEEVHGSDGVRPLKCCRCFVPRHVVAEHLAFQVLLHGD